MEEENLNAILKKIHICLENNLLDIAKEFIEIEIKNLKGESMQQCKNTKYYYYDYYCQYCNNINCICNKKMRGC